MSQAFRADDAATWSGARLEGPGDTRFTAASIDSRTVGPGALFIAIAGPRHDGHDHLAAAAEAGAAGWVVDAEREIPAAPAGLPVLRVPDTTRALGDIAAGHRARFGGPVVAITGSNGKTTTKEMTAAALSAAGPCLKTEGNLNNDYGLPLTLLRREGHERFLVVEMGMNHAGEIARLAEIGRPTIGIVTNVGTAHIEFLGSRDAIATEKGALVEALGPDHVAILNGDDPRVLAQADRTPGRVVRFGGTPGCEYTARDVRYADGAYHFTLKTPAGEVALAITGLGDTTIPNGLAAAAAAHAAGASLAEIAQGLARYRPIAGRLAPVALPGDVLVIDDTYNANPQSVAASLRMLAEGEACRGHRRIAVLGDMGELGAETEKAHRETGALATSLGIDILYAVGSHARDLAGGARAAGFDAARVQEFEDAESAGAALVPEIQPGDRILVKGSRSMRMEHVVERLGASTKDD